ncbi:hypothetical protein ACH5RR_034258 [Cinchona calisaya]|uniref:PB1-like domain-containing protein n=1 Tax=Cinchona calisaya TaxID=153742 RepID=A0ABD2YAD1_9GENT
MLTLEIHHGGQFLQNPDLTYVGGSVKIFDNIDPDYMTRFELFTILNNLTAINMQVSYRMANGEFALLNSDLAVMEMFGMFRDEPFIRIYIEEVAANDQNLGDIVNSDESNESYVMDSDESTEDDSDFEYFLDGDTLNDSCGIDDDGVVNDEVAHNINLEEYAAYVELIRDDYASFSKF